MRNVQPGVVYDIFAKEQDIQIDDSRAKTMPALSPLSPHGALDIIQNIEQVVRGKMKGAGQACGLIGEPGLILQALGFGEVHMRQTADRYTGMFPETIGRSAKIGFGPALIGSEPDICRYRATIRCTASSSLAVSRVREIRK